MYTDYTTPCQETGTPVKRQKSLFEYLMWKTRK